MLIQSRPRRRLFNVRSGPTLLSQQGAVAQEERELTDPNMTPPQGGGMPPQQPAGGGSGMPSWTNNITARGTMSGPGGVALADLPDRIIAWIIDGIILVIAGVVIGTITTTILGDNYVFFKAANLVSSLLAVVLLAAVSAAYFIYQWTRMGGATIGQKVMKVSVRDATSGGPISQQQAINRWLFVGAPFAIWPLHDWNVIGWLLWVAVIAYQAYLLMTTAQSATRQGFHDVQAKTVVAKG
jgi:uncharacterized RDD family membrane protein YckC